ncbi:MAG: prephenate dehydratase [Acidaminococcales bacterium]|jgi:prephenate dehydratase|nr:prephenate dehydratase [Acidaminococcales bacterium]
MPQQRNVACLGPKGSHSEAAARYLFPKENIRLYHAIAGAIDAVCAKEAELCVVPIENSLEGSINITLDRLSGESGFCIARELVWRIRHHLAARSGSASVGVIMSHPQALAQCRENLRKFYPGVPLRETGSTSEAAALAAGDDRVAAISSAEAAQIYNLSIRREDMQDNAVNYTRFVVLRPTPFAAPEENAVKTSIACELDGSKSGVLCGLLQSFAARKINLVRIESRPARTALGRYIFFLDLEGGAFSPGVEEALNEVKGNTLWFKILGSYPVLCCPQI